MSLEVGTKYVLTGPDSTRVVFNDPEDIDFVGYLEAENGLTGLDSPEVRESADVLVGADGGVHGSFYHGRRPITLQGSIHPPDPVEERNRKIDRLQRATNAMRADCELRWTETGTPERLLRLRRQQPVRITGRRPKQFILAMVSADPRIYSSAEQSLTLSPGGGGGYLGLTFPLTFPFGFNLDPGGQTFVVNSGTAPSPPRFRIDGPMTNPVLRNVTTDEELRLNYVLAGDEHLDVDFARKTILLEGTADRYSALQFPGSSWWELQPGNNDVRLESASGGGSAVISWRHAWV